MNSDRRKELHSIYFDGLLEDTLPFWIANSVDREHGGFMMAVDRSGQVIDTDKGIWQQGRFTWLLGELYNEVEPRSEWLELARHGADFLDRYGFDPSDGRMWFHVTRDGRPIRKRRYAYSESFAAIAYGELAKATGEESYEVKAKTTFQRFLSHHLDPPESLSKYTGIRPTRGIGVPMITLVTAQELRDSIGLADANHWIDDSIEQIRRYHVKPEIECVMETVGRDGELLDHFDGRTLNPGHAIEAAWFIIQEGMSREDTALIDLGCRILDWMWARGWDQEYGGILYFAGVDGKPIQEYWHDMKFWWPHNEAIIATLMAFCATGERKYEDWHHLVHQWSYDHFPDPEHGEWYGYLDRTGRVTNTIKGNLWKGPFHLPRMQLLCSRMMEC